MIEDFHVGFHCEYYYEYEDRSGIFNMGKPNYHPVWKTGEMNIETLAALKDRPDLIVTFRVKYLDREDIEAEGWELNDVDEFHGSSRFTMMGKDQRNPPLSEYTLMFSRSGWVLISQNKVPRFSGNIRNRSELHFILKALTII